jgi:hypothetical protein
MPLAGERDEEFELVDHGASLGSFASSREAGHYR